MQEKLVNAAPQGASDQDTWFSLALFAGCVSVLVSVQWVIAAHLHMVPNASLLTQAMAVDLVFGVPLLCWALVVRRTSVPRTVLLPVFLVSVLTARHLIPSTQQGGWMQALPWIAGGVELWVMARGVRYIRTLRQAVRRGERDAQDRITLYEDAFAHVIPTPALARAAAFEAALLATALGSTQAPPPAQDGEVWSTYHEESGAGGLLMALGMVALVELIGVHVVLHHVWGPTPAWVASALSLYGIIWLVGDWRAIKAAPMRFGPQGMALRLGLRWRVDVDWDEVDSVRTLGACEVLPPDDSERLDLVLLGEPQLLVELHRPVTARGPYGWTRQVSRIALGLDTPHACLDAWAQHKAGESTPG